MAPPSPGNICTVVFPSSWATRTLEGRWISQGYFWPLQKCPFCLQLHDPFLAYASCFPVGIIYFSVRCQVTLFNQTSFCLRFNQTSICFSSASENFSVSLTNTETLLVSFSRNLGSAGMPGLCSRSHGPLDMWVEATILSNQNLTEVSRPRFASKLPLVFLTNHNLNPSSLSLCIQSWPLVSDLLHLPLVGMSLSDCSI